MKQNNDSYSLWSVLFHIEKINLSDIIDGKPNSDQHKDSSVKRLNTITEIKCVSFNHSNSIFRMRDHGD